MAEISNIDFWKKAQNHRFWGSPTSKIFFDKLSIKKLRHTKKFGRDPPPRHFRAHFRKSAVEIFFCQISAVIYPEMHLGSPIWQRKDTFFAHSWDSLLKLKPRAHRFEVFDLEIIFPRVFNEKASGQQKFRSGASLMIGILCPFFEKVLFWIFP